MTKFLFTHFTGEHPDGEQVYFAVSQDGRHFHDLNQGMPVLTSTVGHLGVRDPFLVRDEKKQTFYLIATDLRINGGQGWKIAQESGSVNIVVWESADLIKWSEARLLPVPLAEAGNVWAPEAIYDPLKEAFLVFWASRIAGKQKMYAAYTTDFQSLSTPFLFLEKENDVIDSTIIERNGTYYRFTKDETTSRIIMEQSAILVGPYQAMDSPVLTEFTGVEGPQIYQVAEQCWYLILDCFAENLGYTILTTADLGSRDFTLLPQSEYDFGRNLKRHGGVLAITDEEYQRLTKFFN